MAHTILDILTFFSFGDHLVSPSSDTMCTIWLALHKDQCCKLFTSLRIGGCMKKKITFSNKRYVLIERTTFAYACWPRCVSGGETRAVTDCNIKSVVTRWTKMEQETQCPKVHRVSNRREKRQIWMW